MRYTQSQRDIGCGMAIAAAIIMRCWGDEVAAEEILRAGGLDTLRRLRASGVEQYDIDALKPVISHIRRRAALAKDREP